MECFVRVRTYKDRDCTAWCFTCLTSFFCFLIGGLSQLDWMVKSLHCARSSIDYAPSMPRTNEDDRDSTAEYHILEIVRLMFFTLYALDRCDCYQWIQSRTFVVIAQSISKYISIITSLSSYYSNSTHL